MRGSRVFGYSHLQKMAAVELRAGESQEELLKRFRKRVTESGILSTRRKKRWFVSKGEKRRQAKDKAIRRARRREARRRSQGDSRRRRARKR